jgi:ribulose-phosphate 3-epimerase
MGLPVVKALHRVAARPLDEHLMIAEPDRYIEGFAANGAAMISVHVETVPHLHRTLTFIRSLGARAGAVLNPSTPVSAIEEVTGELDYVVVMAVNPGTPISTLEYVLDLVDLVLVMSVNPGFGGQAFIPSQLDKIRAIRKLIGARPIHIEVDGGINAETAPLVVEAGANVIVAGSGVFKGGAYQDNIAAIRAAASRARVAAA